MSDLGAQPAPQFAPPTHPAPPAEPVASQVPAQQQFAPQPPVAPQAPVAPQPPAQSAPAAPAMAQQQFAPQPAIAPINQPAPAMAQQQYSLPTQPAPAQPAPQVFDPTQGFDPTQAFDNPQSHSVAQPQYADQAYDPYANPYAIPRDKPEAGNGKIVAAYILAFFSVFILPIILGPIAIFLASKSKSEGNPKGATAMAVAIGAMCLGFVFGFLALGALGS